MMDALVVSEPLGEMASHVVVPLVPDALAVNEVGLEAVTESVWDAGAEPPARALNVNDVGLKLSVVVVPVSVSVTGTDCVVPFALSRTDPLYVPAGRLP